MVLDWTELAQLAYEAYGKSTEWKNYQGKLMPQYDKLPYAIQQAWEAACQAVVTATGIGDSK